jgi:hypothetical protein
MAKKYLASLLVVLLAIGFVSYWIARQRARPTLHMAALPPAQALGFIALPGLPQAWADLRQTKFFAHVSSPAFWEVALGPEGYRRLMEGKQQLEQQLGLVLTEQTVGMLLGREVGLALIPSQREDRPLDVIAYIKVSGTEKVVESLSRTFSTAMSDLVRETQVVDGIEIITLRPKGASGGISYAYVGSLAVLATDPAWVVDAFKAGRGAATERLYSQPFMQEMQVEQSDALLAYGYYDVARMQAHLVARMPWAAHLPPATTIPLLQTTRQLTIKAMRARDGVMLEAMALYHPNVASQILRRTEREAATPPFRGAPAETFYLTYIDLFNLQGIWQWLKPLAAVGAQDGLERKLDQFRAWTGADLERDLLPAFTGVVGLGVTGPFGPQVASALPLPGFFLTLGITDEARVNQLIQTVGGHVGGPQFPEFLQRKTHNGHEICYLGNLFLPIKPGYVIGHNQLLLGSDSSLLQHMLDAAEGRTNTLADANTYQEMRKHVRLKGGTMTFVDVTTALAKAGEWRTRLAFLAQGLTRTSPSAPPADLAHADPWTLLELIRPVHYVGAVSQAEVQGVRTEVFIAFEDLK